MAAFAEAKVYPYNRTSRSIIIRQPLVGQKVQAQQPHPVCFSKFEEGVMGYFKDAAELHQILGALYDRVKADPEIAPKICQGKIIVQFRYTEPAGIVTINAAAPPTQPGAFCDVLWGDEVGLKPDIEMRMKADVAHEFWHGKVNLMTALTRRQIVAKGPIPKILRLLPAVAPVYVLYPQLLREIGREDLVLA